ncbi:MAG: glucose-6-phosphate isomerase [Planctomycetota bacterium]|nr:glucose-6-phosphate isomerase [Planctomycetota bacterium]MDA1214465.1 glucose-6-phosphate isomerase [Planctomycetota bacterium]
MSFDIQYDATAALKHIKKKHWRNLESELLDARNEVFADVDLMASDQKIPKSKQPLDAGFISLPQQLLDEHDRDKAHSLLGRIQAAADHMRNEVDQVVSLGIGGSYMGARALFEALCHPYHNELTRQARENSPRLYFEGDNLDNDSLSALQELLQQRCRDRTDKSQRWGLVVISKSGGTLETAVAFRLFRNAIEKYYGDGSTECRQLVIPVTGESGKLRDLANVRKYEHVFPIPDGVGGRFSIFTTVGLLPAAILGLDIVELLKGAAAMTARFQSASFGENPVLDYTATCHLLETESNIDVRVLSTWGKSLEAVGLWYDQLLAESLGKKEKGALPLTVVNTRDLHSRGQQHQEGARDKIITNVIVEAPRRRAVSIPQDDLDQDQLNRFQGKAIPELLTAAIKGTNQAYADDERPTADIRLPVLSEHTLGQLFQMLMLATVLEGRLIGINPYGQPGVEAYKNNMLDILTAGNAGK